ncbi:NifB/NifX family molybdenum-iron cluster-binding protein [Candidatus Woesearchaeota archaeon]|nr:NifB/NifX family molybdenum-iron cluster-binding protein [Candidatus Woesearchaeota archaeon]
MKRTKNMRIAVASAGKDPADMVSDKGGRAPYYLIFDNDKLIKSIKNPFSVGGGGAGVSVAYMLSKEEVDVVVAGDLGPNMVQALDENKIKSMSLTGMAVADAVKRALE